MDEVRRAEQRRPDLEDAKALKGARYDLLKHPARLKPKEARRLEKLRRANRALDRAYELKEYLATILEQAPPEEAPELLEEWLDWAARSRLAPFVKLGRTIRKHAEGILAYLDTRMTNGPVEGINNRLRVIARRAYGFHSPDALISMLFLCCGGIELVPPLPHAFEEIHLSAPVLFEDPDPGPHVTFQCRAQSRSDVVLDDELPQGFYVRTLTSFRCRQEVCGHQHVQEVPPLRCDHGIERFADLDTDPIPLP